MLEAYDQNPEKLQNSYEGFVKVLMQRHMICNATGDHALIINHGTGLANLIQIWFDRIKFDQQQAQNVGIAFTALFMTRENLIEIMIKTNDLPNAFEQLALLKPVMDDMKSHPLG